MSIICFEGASAVGKTTTSNVLKDNGDAFVVPEVNQLFGRTGNEPVRWYFERQVERWQIAIEQSKNYRCVILDGDPFQPLWYNWSYDFVGSQKLDFMEQFYRSAIEAGLIAFPHLYFIFGTSEIELRRRRAGDATRRRRHFETHLKMIAPQRRYFEAMRDQSPARVYFLEADSIESNIEFICRNIEELKAQNFDEPGRLLNKMITWLGENKA